MKIAKYIAVLFAIYLIVAVLWRLLFDQVTGRTRAAREKVRFRPEISEIAARVETNYHRTKLLPTNAVELSHLDSVWRAIREAEQLTNTYTLTFQTAQARLDNGESNVPIAFERLKQVKDERGGFIAFVFPLRAEWYSKTQYVRLLSDATNVTRKQMSPNQ